MKIKKITDKHIKRVYGIGKNDFRGQLWFSENFLRETINTPGYYYGVFDGDNLVGVILARKFDRPKLWIFYLAVDKEHRRRGIGTKLIQAVIKSANRRHDLLFADSSRSDKAANRFYRANGFKRAGTVKPWFGADDSGVIFYKNMT